MTRKKKQSNYGLPKSIKFTQDIEYRAERLMEAMGVKNESEAYRQIMTQGLKVLEKKYDLS
jgi:glutamine cyclotransferase